MKKIWIIIAIIALVIISAYAITSKNSKNQTIVEEQPSSQGPIQCTDPICLKPQFLTCNPSELKMPFVDGNFYVITVFGVENGKCHYTRKIVDQNNAVLSEGMGTLDCVVPLEQISADTLDHFFGVDAEEGKEAIKATQDKIEKDYCVTQ